MTTALAMIVRDEEKNLVRCLDSARPHIDRVVLVDTGSVDATRDVARAWAAANGVELDLIEEPWQNFAVNRTSLMQHARGKADWLLLLDADLVVHYPDVMPDLEAADEWQGRIGTGALDYTLPFLVRGSKPWRYVGVAHAYLACDEPFEEQELVGLWVEDYSSTGPEKLERDLVALLADHSANPKNTRTVFYLAQTYYDLDRVHEAIHYYRMRAEMGGWDEEVYVSRLRVGELLAEHVSFAAAAPLLMEAWAAMPDRIEALRVLAGAATSVANKMPYPAARKLFVNRNAYGEFRYPVKTREPLPVAPGPLPPFPPIAPERRRRPRVTKLRGLNPRDVTAIIVTRGNVDLAPTLDALHPEYEVVVYNNAERPIDYKVFGWYAAIPEATRPVLFRVDDDVVFTAHDELLRAYEPGRLVCNMDEGWIEGAGYRGLVGMQGAGSLCDSHVHANVWDRYLAAYPFDDDCLVECDFVFGTLVPFTVVDLGYQIREFSDDADRLYQQPGQTERKWKIINRCRELVEAAA